MCWLLYRAYFFFLAEMYFWKIFKYKSIESNLNLYDRQNRIFKIKYIIENITLNMAPNLSFYFMLVSDIFMVTKYFETKILKMFWLFQNVKKISFSICCFDPISNLRFPISGIFLSTKKQSTAGTTRHLFTGTFICFTTGI